MNILTCDRANQGAVAFRQGLGISDNPWVPGYNPPYMEANQWLAGYVTEELRHAKVVTDAQALAFGEAAWIESNKPLKHYAVIEAMQAMMQKD